jgi:hypothetical protein
LIGLRKLVSGRTASPLNKYRRVMIAPIDQAGGGKPITWCAIRAGWQAVMGMASATPESKFRSC